MSSTHSCPTRSSNSLQMQRLWKRLWNIFKSIKVLDHKDDDAAAHCIWSLPALSSSLLDINPTLPPSPTTTKLYRRRRRTNVRAVNLPLCKEKQEENGCPSMDQKDQTQGNTLMVPPFSPTYGQPNHFPYSNFYIKLPDGRWMIRFRDGNRSILGTDVIQGELI